MIANRSPNTHLGYEWLSSSTVSTFEHWEQRYAGSVSRVHSWPGDVRNIEFATSAIFLECQARIAARVDGAG
jgi:hypothetical protein